MDLDVSKLSDEELIGSYQRINKEKYPGNFQAAHAEILRRNLLDRANAPPEIEPLTFGKVLKVVFEMLNFISLFGK